MAITRTEPRRRSARVWLPLCALALAPGARAAVVFEPEVSVGIARTDNVTLASEDEEAETVYQLIPAFNLTQQASRLTASAAYRLEGYYYDERSDSEIYHLLDAELSAALDPDNFFIDLGASRSQTIRDPEAAIPSSNLPISGNRIERDEFYLGPRFAYPLGANATVNGSYQRSWIQYDDDPDLGGFGGFRRDFEEDTAAVSVDNYRRERGLTWAVRYNSAQTDYGQARAWEHRQASVELGAWIGQGLRLFATGGMESAWDQPFDPSLEDDFWEAGVSKTVGDRFSAEVAAGERTFGSSRRGSLNFNFRRGSTGLTYAEAPTTQERNPYRGSGLLLPPELEDFLTRPGNAERYLSKRLQWNLDVELRRTGFGLALFDESREDRTRIDGTPLDDESQTGATVNVTWQAGARTDVTFRLRRLRREFAAADESEYTSASIGAGYTLGPRTQLSLDYSHTEEDSSREGAGRDYTANLISFLLTRTF